jgi:hypothetical protein
MEQQAATEGQRESNAASMVTELKEQVTEQAQGLAEQAQEVAESQKGRLAEGAAGVAEALHHASEGLRADDQQTVGDYADALAGQVDKVARFLQSRDLPTMAREVSGFARRQPALFLGGAFTLGIVAARFLKSSGGGAGQPSFPGEPRSSGGQQSFGQQRSTREPQASGEGGQLIYSPLTDDSSTSSRSDGDGEYDGRPDPAVSPPGGVPPLPSAHGGGL